ncbi:MAG: hypothetical protein LBJ23_05185, partial [Tannerella sp.]|nr:hypothetical protein [Tannerella sp.]
MYCSNCRNQIDGTGRFCVHCGAQITGIITPPPPPYNAKSSGNSGVLKGCMIAAGIFVAVIIAFCVGLYFFNDDFREGFNEGMEEESGYNFSSQVKYSNLSSAEQEKLMNDLYERLDEFFLTALQDDEQLMQLLFIGAISGENEALSDKMFEKKFGNKMINLVEKWVKDSNINADDFGSSIDEDEFAAGYFL